MTKTLLKAAGVPTTAFAVVRDADERPCRRIRLSGVCQADRRRDQTASPHLAIHARSNSRGLPRVAACSTSPC